MMSPHALDDFLDDRHRGDQTEAAMTALSPASLPEPMACGGCGGLVGDRFFLLAAGRAWHNSCLRCGACHGELQTHSSLFWRDGAIYCLHDYCRLFGGGECARCLQPIPASALVMKSGDLTFHQHCFSCQECEVQLEPGSLYCVQGQSLFCQFHCSSSLSPPEAPCYPEDLTPGESHAGTEGEESESSGDGPLADGSLEGQVHRREKRIRTCFRSEQIRALESYFSKKQNPDGKDWTRLSHQTGLPKRVLQVWFQNARARLRRSLNNAPDVGDAPFAHLGPLAPPSPPFFASTIDQSQLSLLMAPISPDYDSHDAPGAALHALRGEHDPHAFF